MISIKRADVKQKTDLHRLFLLYPLYPPVLKISGYNGYNECKEPDIHSEMQRKNNGNALLKFPIYAILFPKGAIT